MKIQINSKERDHLSDQSVDEGNTKTDLIAMKWEGSEMNTGLWCARQLLIRPWNRQVIAFSHISTPCQLEFTATGLHNKMWAWGCHSQQSVINYNLKPYLLRWTIWRKKTTRGSLYRWEKSRIDIKKRLRCPYSRHERTVGKLIYCCTHS